MLSRHLVVEAVDAFSNEDVFLVNMNLDIDAQDRRKSS
jgi:hypothetical protein